MFTIRNAACVLFAAIAIAASVNSVYAQPGKGAAKVAKVTHAVKKAPGTAAVAPGKLGMPKQTTAAAKIPDEQFTLNIFKKSPATGNAAAAAGKLGLPKQHNGHKETIEILSAKASAPMKVSKQPATGTPDVQPFQKRIDKSSPLLQNVAPNATAPAAGKLGMPKQPNGVELKNVQVTSY